MDTSKFMSYNPEYVPSQTMQSILTDPVFSTDPMDFYSGVDIPSNNYIKYLDEPVSKFEDILSTPVIEKPDEKELVIDEPNYNTVKGYDSFKKYLDEAILELPELEKYKKFLTKIANAESGFNSSIQNMSGAPAYGYFQFMQDGNKYNNIKRYSGLSTDEFRSNPKEQIKAAYRLIKDFEKGLSKEDLEKAAKQGYSSNALLAGAWLGGNGGVRKVLNGTGNPSDRNWSKSGAGTDVKTRMQQFNFKKGGKL